MRSIFLLLSVISMAALMDGDLVQFFKRAMAKANCSDKQAYTDLGYSQSQFSRMMAGLEPPRFLARIHRLENKEVVRWFGFEISTHAGLPRDVKRAMPITLAMLGARSMAKASLQSSRRSRDTQRYLDQKKAKVS